jgi:hypothetical protein
MESTNKKIFLQYSPLQTVINRASKKFGEVLKVENKTGDLFFLTIKRKEPIFFDAPFMTINAKIFGMNEDGEYMVDFYHGHYDLKTV